MKGVVEVVNLDLFTTALPLGMELMELPTALILMVKVAWDTELAYNNANMIAENCNRWSRGRCSWSRKRCGI